MSYHCTTSPMEDRTETSWSECFQDLASWCHQPQDELHTPNVTNQSEFNYSFEDQSMYYPGWEANPLTVDLKGENMWKPQESLPLQYPPEEDNNNTFLPLMPDKQSAKDNGMRYSVNYVVSGIDQDLDSSHDIINNWNIPASNPDLINLETIISTKRPNIPLKEVTLQKPKPQLNLNIVAANTKSSNSSDLPIQGLLHTPVLDSILSDPTPKFNLVDFCESFDDQSLMSVDPNSIIMPRPKETKIASSQQVIKIDHDYTECIPSSRVHLVSSKSVNIPNEVEILPVIPEDIKPELTVKEEPSSPLPSTSASLGKRLRKIMADEDFIYEDDSPSDNSADWSPVKKKSKTMKKKMGEGSRTRTPSFSDTCSVSSGPDKYRELRDKNNEASRRSRLNRKQKEEDMMKTATDLEKDNQQLKDKAEKLEERVKTMRRILIQIAKKDKRV